MDKGAIQSDSYIEGLLGAHARLPVPMPRAENLPSPSLRHVIRLLETGMPRFHPSFLFEERLAGQLRTAAAAVHTPASTDGLPVGDRRVWVGGAIASTVAGAAVFAWRRRRDHELT